MRWMTVLRVLFYSFLAIPASAQTTFAGLNQKGVDTIFVTDRAGHETKGLLVGLTDSTVTVVTAGGPQTFVADDVVRLDRRGDSLKNGALIGMGIGIVGMLPGFAETHATCHDACRSVRRRRAGDDSRQERFALRELASRFQLRGFSFQLRL